MRTHRDLATKYLEDHLLSLNWDEFIDAVNFRATGPLALEACAQLERAEEDARKPFGISSYTKAAARAHLLLALAYGHEYDVNLAVENYDYMMENA